MAALGCLFIVCSNIAMMIDLQHVVAIFNDAKNGSDKVQLGIL